MKIKINQIHKSINAPCEFELPNFSVLTGKNGSGKTHLLEAIGDYQKSDVWINENPTKNIRYIPFNGLNPHIEEVCDPNSIIQFTKNAWERYRSELRAKKPPSLERLLRFINDKNIGGLIEKTIRETGKLYDELTEDDLGNCFDISFMRQEDFFTAQFAHIFKNYHRRQLENELNKLYQSNGTLTTRPVLLETEFENKYGVPPWVFVNRVLKDTNIPYEVNNPLGTRLESSFTFKLKDRVKGFEISSADLSTGEKVLMSLALAVYNTNSDIGKPELLLIDEPDAGLHPSMSTLMVKVLKENIVEGSNIPVIISTHSPTTVIASEGISIYQLERGSSIPRKVSAQEGVEILSSDIPFLRISTEKRRQVFVESKYDVTYYELLTNIYRKFKNLPAEPIFIPARTSSGSNCSDVIGIVTDLSTNGNEQVYGIIDWDKTNISNGKILVLGENDRYAIENYLLDPLLMGLLFIRENKIPFSNFAGLRITTYPEIINLTMVDAQIINDKVLSDLGLLSGNKVDYELINGWTLQTSQEFNNYHGHDLETLYKTKYPFLNSYNREEALKRDVIEKVVNDYPFFSPKELCAVIKRII